MRKADVHPPMPDIKRLTCSLIAHADTDNSRQLQRIATQGRALFELPLSM
jgi:hypothetical protein